MENDVAVPMEKQNFLHASWRKMTIFPVCLGCKFQKFRRMNSSCRQADIPLQCSDAELTRCGGMRVFDNKKTNVANADPLLSEHQSVGLTN